jgi:hypothetical protein
MKRAIFAVFVTMFPLAVAAQDTAAAPPAGTDTTATTSTADAPTPEVSQYTPARRGGRRPSMVGYIEDATVGSNFRIRYDSGWDIDSPDRAEFFYAKCGCYRTLPASSGAYDPSAPGPGPGIVKSLNFSQLYVLTEHNVGPHASVFVELPYRWIRPTDFVAGTGSFSNESGLADIRFGTKLALVSAPSHDITLMVRGSIPTGDSTKGLGIDHGSFEPALLVRQTLGSRVQLEGEFGDFHPTGSSKGPVAGNGNFAGDVLYYGIGPSFDIVSTKTLRFAPVVELVGWHVLGGYETSTFVSGGSGDASGTNIVNLKIGGRVAMAKGGSFYVGYGWALTSEQWYDHILRFEYRTKF